MIDMDSRLRAARGFGKNETNISVADLAVGDMVMVRGAKNGSSSTISAALVRELWKRP